MDMSHARLTGVADPHCRTVAQTPERVTQTRTQVAFSRLPCGRIEMGVSRTIVCGRGATSAGADGARGYGGLEGSEAARPIRCSSLTTPGRSSDADGAEGQPRGHVEAELAVGSKCAQNSRVRPRRSATVRASAQSGSASTSWIMRMFT